MTVRRVPTRRATVAAGLIALCILPGIAGCGAQPTADPVAAGGSTASPTSSVAARSSATRSTAVTPTVSTPPPVTSLPPEMPSAAVMSSSAAVPAGQVAAALGALALLVVRDEDSQIGYQRALFGQAWSDDVTVDDGHNGCDTRNDILRRDLIAVQIKPGTNGCVVLNGTLADPYSAANIAFMRGASTSDDVQIDHLVALSDAWRSGAQALTPDQRQNFANDPLNLLAVSGPLNQEKGGGDAASWLPPNVAFRCAYVVRQIEVKTRYALWVVPAEHDAMLRVLTDCGDLAQSPVSAPPPPAATSAGEPATPAPAPEPAVTSQTTAGSGYFKNCAAARAAGVTPLFRGQPGYRDSMDGDRDGIACEN